MFEDGSSHHNFLHHDKIRRPFFEFALFRHCLRLCFWPLTNHINAQPKCYSALTCICCIIAFIRTCLSQFPDRVINQAASLYPTGRHHKGGVRLPHGGSRDKTILNSTLSEGQEAYYSSTTWTRNKSTRQDGRVL